MKKNKQNNIILSCCLFLIFTLSACSLSGENNKKENNKKEDNVVVTPKVITVSPDNDDYIKIGEPFKVLRSVYNQPDKLELEYTVNKVKTYKNVDAAGIKKEQIVSPEIHSPSFPDSPKCIEKDITMKSKVLIADISIKNIDFEEENITDIFLVYENDKQLVELGSPFYFSNSINLDSKYYDYTALRGQTIDVKVGWVIDSKILKVDKLDESKLYLASSFDGEEECRKIIKLDLK